MRTSVRVAVCVMAMLAVCSLALGQQKMPAERQQEKMQIGEYGMNMMNATQIATMYKDTKRSLTDSISAAEKHCGGRAVQAEFCYQEGPGQAREGMATRPVVCVVTVLVGDDRLVKAIVNTQNGEIINKHDVNAVALLGMGRGGEFAMAQRWEKATELRGKKLVNANGDDLGKIEDIITDPRSGRIIFGIVSFGGFLGLGDKFYPVPWPALQLTGDAKAFVLNADQSLLKNATGFASDKWPNIDEQFVLNTYKYYGETPYWQYGEGRTMVEPTAMPEGYRARWFEPPTDCQKISDVCRKEVRTTQTEDVGKLNDVAIDPDNGRLLFGILAYRDKFYAIPWSVLTLSTDDQHIVLNADKTLLTDTVAFGNYNWPNLTNPAWATEIYTHYNVEPYWTAPMRETTVRR